MFYWLPEQTGQRILVERVVSFPQWTHKVFISLKQNSLYINPFRSKQMHFGIKVCQGYRRPFQSSLGAVTDAPFDFCVSRKKRRTYKHPETGQLYKPANWKNRMYIINFGLGVFKQLSRHCRRVRWSSPTYCLSECHKNLHYKRVRCERLLDLILHAFIDQFI